MGQVDASQDPMVQGTDPGTCISGILKGGSLATRQDINTTSSEHREGADASQNTDNATSVIGIGNAFLTAYSVNGV